MSKQQRAETDLAAVREIAKSMVYLEPEPVEQLPIFVRHPFANSGIVGLYNGDGSLRMGNILENEADKAQWRKQVSQTIDRCGTAQQIGYLIEKPYLLGFFKYASPYLSAKDHAEMLADAWIRCEEPNHDPNLSQGKLLAMFRAADPGFLMDDEERKCLAELPDPVTVYRGVRSDRMTDVSSLSWTLEPKTALWFANRYGRQGRVYEAKISKAHIHALFHGRGESEIILDPRHLMELSQMQKMDMPMTMEGM